MEKTSLGAMESRFADLVWANAPLTSAQLIKLCEKELRWARTTTYTVLKKLSTMGLFQNQGGIVTAQISRQEFYALQSEKFVEEAFDGSLPAFLVAFSSRKKLSEAEIDQLQRLIDESRG